jgi:large subunit ribosomal protein L5
MTPRLLERYRSQVIPKLKQEFGYTNIHQVPKLEKIVVNMGVGEATQNAKLLEKAAEELAAVTGQKPVIRRARKSIANFKLREGMAVGVKVTLRGERMYEMLDRLQSIAIPRIRDFRGLSRRSFDGRGNFSLGIREQIIFPEIDYDSIDEVRGLDVTITTSAASDEEGYELLRLLGMPFRTDNGAAAAARPAEAPAEAPQAEESEPPAEASQETVEEPAAEETVEDEAAEEADEMPQDTAAETSADESEEA